MTPETVEHTLVPLAAELIGTIRDFGPDDVAAVLARVPDGRHDALAVVLAAMVDPDRSAADLLAWTEQPVQSRTWEPVSLRPDLTRNPCPECDEMHPVNKMARHRRTHAQGAA